MHKFCKDDRQSKCCPCALPIMRQGDFQRTGQEYVVHKIKLIRSFAQSCDAQFYGVACCVVKPLSELEQENDNWQRKTQGANFRCDGVVKRCFVEKVAERQAAVAKEQSYSEKCGIAALFAQEIRQNIEADGIAQKRAQQRAPNGRYCICQQHTGSKPNKPDYNDATLVGTSKPLKRRCYKVANQQMRQKPQLTATGNVVLRKSADRNDGLPPVRHVNGVSGDEVNNGHDSDEYIERE